MTKPDVAFNLAIGAVALLFIFFAGYAMGRQSGQYASYQDLAAQHAQTLRDFAKYPLGRPHFFLGPEGLGATCAR